MRAFQDGDASAFRTLFERHAPAMVAFCHRFVRNAARAEELAQDVFLKLHASAKRYHPSARFKTFLYRIASNHCLNELRRGEYRGRRGSDPDGPTDPDTLAGPWPNPEDAARGTAMASAFAALLSQLPEKQRVAFVLCRMEGLSYDEIAEVLDTSVSAVKSLIHRATVAAADALAPFSAAEGRKVLP